MSKNREMVKVLDVHMIMSIFHLAFVVPLFLFVGYQRSDTPRWVYLSLMTIGVLIILYHSVRLVQRYGKSVFVWVHVIHALLIGPLLFYIGYHGRDSPRWTYELMLILGFGACGYHLFQLVKGLEAYPDAEPALSSKPSPSYLHSV
jgi:hypothetical protein